MRDSDYNLYRKFLEVAKYNSFTKAAENLCISQPAVTQSVKKLEETLNTELFVRNAKNIELSETGKIVYYYAQQICNTVKATENAVLEYHVIEKKYLTIGVPTHLGIYYLSRFLLLYRRFYPDVYVKIINKSSQEMLELLEKREIDVVIDTDMKINNDDLIGYCKLNELESCFVANSDFINKIGKKKICDEDLQKYPFILPGTTTFNRRHLNMLLERKNIKLEPLVEVNSSSICKSLVLSGLGIGWMIKNFVQRELNNGKLYIIDTNIESFNVNVTVAYHKQFNQKHVNKFIETLQNTTL